MKRKMSFAIFALLLLVSALAFYVCAQVQPDTKTQQYQKAREAYEKLVSAYPFAASQGAKAPVTLCTGPTMATDGTAKCLYQALPASGKLRIEMQDGTTQEVDLKNVKKMTVE